ncbi:hypothetical protein ABMA70_14805 [Halobacteriovorax sp. XZX-3]|uniref:hypothetical protein n=1 Tax=unclassified Halobacteriovorax TaxID=2639665 RepID=UPI003714121F
MVKVFFLKGIYEVMDNQNKWRIEFAKEIVSEVSNEEDLEAIFIGGSVSRGVADKYSDLEICFVWKNKISDEKRKSLISQMNGENFTEFKAWKDQDVVEDNIYINGFQVDVWHNTVEGNQRDIDDVLKNLSTNLSKLNFLYTIQHSIPLLDSPTLEAWKTSITNYPEELGLKLTKEHLSVFGSGNYHIHIERKDWAIFYGLISGYQKRIFLALLGINKMYYPTYKRMDKAFSEMEAIPERINEAFEKMYQSSPYEAWEELSRLMKETALLGEKVYGEINASQIIERISSKRDVQEKKPNLS